MTVLDLRCCVRTFSSCSKQGLLSRSVRRLLIAVVSLVEHGLSAPKLQQFQSMGSVTVEHRLRCPRSMWIFPDQGFNSCPLYWQVDSLPLSHQGSPGIPVLRDSSSVGPMNSQINKPKFPSRTNLLSGNITQSRGGTTKETVRSR